MFLLEELPNLPIDDSDGTTSYVESECVEVIEKILEKCKNDSIINKIFNWIIESIKNDTLGDYSDGIEKVLDEYFIEDKFVNEKARFTGKRNYEDVRKILQHMKTLKNGKKLVEKMVEEYKIKYANRRLMLEELNKI